MGFVAIDKCHLFHIIKGFLVSDVGHSKRR